MILDAPQTDNAEALRHSYGLASYGLAIDTSSAVLTLALSTLGELEINSRARAWHLEREISAQLHPLLQDFMMPQQWTDLGWIAVLKGPGSFTGTRIGVVTARTLAQQLNIPLFGFSNLAIAAWMDATRQGIGDRWVVAVSQPGRLGYTYGAVYEVQNQTGTITALSPDQLVTLEDWNKILAVHEPTLDTHLKLSLEPLVDPSLSLGTALLTLGWKHWNQGLRPQWHETLPYYG
jgi:tRNA threonylcarbamoyl adenosine modification protein YeaZ